MRTAYILGILGALAVFVACSSSDNGPRALGSAADAGDDSSSDLTECGATEVCPCADGFKGSAAAGCGITANCASQCASHGGTCNYTGADCTCGDGTAQYPASCAAQATCALVCAGHCGDADGGMTTDCLDAGDDSGPVDASLD